MNWTKIRWNICTVKVLTFVRCSSFVQQRKMCKSGHYINYWCSFFLFLLSYSFRFLLFSFLPFFLPFFLFCNLFYLYFLSYSFRFLLYFLLTLEEYWHDQINMTEWIWPNFVNMANFTAKTNIIYWTWPKNK